MLAQFRQTLESFTHTLQFRGIFTRLGIEPCDPAKCDIHYVLKVAKTIREHKEGSKDTRSIKRFMERCSKRAAANKATISALLSMVPNDIYSVISGGFSLILAVRGSRFAYNPAGIITDKSGRPSRNMKTTGPRSSLFWPTFPVSWTRYTGWLKLASSGHRCTVAQTRSFCPSSSSSSAFLTS